MTILIRTFVTFPVSFSFLICSDLSRIQLMTKTLSITTCLFTPAKVWFSYCVARKASVNCSVNPGPNSSFKVSFMSVPHRHFLIIEVVLHISPSVFIGNGKQITPQSQTRISRVVPIRLSLHLLFLKR